MRRYILLLGFVRGASLLFTAAILLATRAAFADGTTPVRLTYSAPDECPRQESFVYQVTRRTSHFRLAQPPEPSTLLDVTIDRGEGGKRFLGRVKGTDPAGVVTARELPGDTCAEVVAGLALVTALSIDPEASTAALPEAPTDSTPPKPPAVVVEPPRSVPPAPRVAPSPVVVEASARWRFAAVGLASVEGGVTPGVVPAARIAVEASYDRTSKLWSPTLILGFARSLTKSVALPGSGSGAFTWTAGSIGACPLRASVRAFDFIPCLRGEFGALDGEGVSIVNGRSRTTGWVSGALDGRVRWRVAGPLLVDFEGGGRANLVRKRYFFEPDATVFQAPALGWFLALGLGVRFL